MNRILYISSSLVRFSRSAYLVVLFCLLCALSYSQNFPVQVVTQALPPAPIYVSNYADASTVNSPLRVQITLNDFEISNREIRLKTYFTGSGLTFQSNDIVVGASPLFLEGGIPLVLTNVELAPYFEFNNITGINANQYGNPIPEGAYQFCVEVYDVLTGSRLSNRSCAVSVVFQNEPPFLVLPRNKENVDEVNPQYIVFQWTPRSINVSNVEYELSLVEIWDTQVDPQQAFLSSPPVFQTTTSATTYVYGPADPLLLSGKNYAWRVQAKAKQGIEEIGLFKNQGYSEIFSFSYAGSCDLPLVINHEVKGSTNANIFWDDFSTEIPEFTVRYRQKKVSDAEWFLAKTTTNDLTIWNLKAGTTYEYQLSKNCGVTQSDWSYTKEFTTALEFEEESVLDCGVSPDINLTNMEPLASIGNGATFNAGDFPVKILEVSGGNGRFTGKGYVTLPYLKNIKVAVEFTNILINTDSEMAEGSVRTAYDADWGNILDTGDVVDVVDDVGDVFTGGDNVDYEVDFEINSVNDIKIEDGEIIITGPNGETKTFDHDDGDTYQIKDAGGDTYNIDEDGNITKGAEAAEGGEATAQNTDGISGGSGTADAPSVSEITANGISVTFKKSANTKYDLDIADSDFEKSKYPKAQLANGTDYYPIHKAVVDGQTDEFLAEISISNSNISIDDLIVKTVSGSKIDTRKEGNSNLIISLKGVNSYRSEEAIVTYKDENDKYKIAASFFIHHIKQQELVNVVVVSVNGTAQLANLEQELNGIFGKAGAQFKVSTDSFSLQATDWDDNSNGKLDYDGSGLLSDYPQELKNIQQKYKQDKPSWDAKAYHLFLLPNDMSLTKPLSGFMPKTRQWGYIFNAHKDDALENKSSQNLIAAHELGHGVFKLAHPFQNDENKSGSGSNWLMDYNSGDQLPYAHWAAMSDESLQLFLFQDEEDSESTVVKQIPKEFLNSDEKSYTFMTLNGSYITLPDNVKDIWFSTGLDQLDKFVDYPAGAIIRFTIGDEVFKADVNRNDLLFGNTSQVFFEKENLNFTYNGFKNVKTNKKYEVEGYNNNKVDGYVISLLPYTATSGSTQGIGGYSLQRIVRRDLSFKENTSFNLLDANDYDNIQRFYKADADVRKHLEYRDKTFPYQFELQKSLMDEIIGLGTWSSKHPLLVKYAILYNSQPDVFKSVVGNVFDKDYLKGLEEVSLQELKDAYPKVITGIFNRNIDLVNQFNDIVDGKRNLVGQLLFDELHKVIGQLSSEEIKTKIDFERRKKALEILLKNEDNKYLYDSLYENLVNTDRYEDQILRLVKFIPDSQINSLISYLESDKNNEKEHLWHFIFRKTDDTFIWNKDNRSEFVKIVTEKYYKSQRFADEYKKVALWENNSTINRKLLDQRNIDSDYRDIFQRTWTQLKIVNPVIGAHIDNLEKGDFYIKYDTEYLSDTGGISVDKKSTVGFMTNSLESYNLKPFDLIFFRTSSNIALLRDYKTNELKPVPAIVLYYDDDRRNADTTSDIVFTVIDVATLAIPGAQFAQLGKIGRVFFILDKASSVTSLAGNAIENTDPETSKILNQVSLVLGVADLTNITGNAIKAKLAKNIDQSVDDYKTAVNLIGEAESATISNLTDIQKKDVKTVLAAEYDALKAEGITSLDELKLIRVFNKLDNIAQGAVTYYQKLTNKASSLSDPSFSQLTNKIKDQSHIWLGETGIPIIQTPTAFLNEVGNSMYDLVIEGKYYAKYDLSDGRILLGDVDGNYYAFVQEISSPIINTGDNADEIIEAHIINRVNNLRTFAGLNGVSTLNVLGKTITTDLNKVNTFLGRFNPDMSALFNEIGNYKNLDLGEVNGGINILNRPKAYESIGDWWGTHNLPWLQRAVERADEIYLATLPTRKADVISDTDDLLGMFARELNFLVKRNHKPKNISETDWSIIIEWFKDIP